VIRTSKDLKRCRPPAVSQTRRLTRHVDCARPGARGGRGAAARVPRAGRGLPGVQPARGSQRRWGQGRTGSSHRPKPPHRNPNTYAMPSIHRYTGSRWLDSNPQPITRTAVADGLLRPRAAYAGRSECRAERFVAVRRCCTGHQRPGTDARTRHRHDRWVMRWSSGVPGLPPSRRNPGRAARLRLRCRTMLSHVSSIPCSPVSAVVSVRRAFGRPQQAPPATSRKQWHR